MSNTPDTDNGARSIADILGESGVDLSVLDSGQIDTTDEPLEEPAPPARDEKGRYTRTKADDDPSGLPAILRDDEEEEPESGDLPTDEEIAETLKDLPEDKRAQSEKGIQKLVNRAKGFEAELQARAERVKALESWEAALMNPETAEIALERLQEAVRQVTGRTTPTQAQHDVSGDEDELWGQETAAQTKARWKREFKEEMLREIGPDIQEFRAWKAEQARMQQIEGKVSTVTQQLKTEYGEFATPERVREAVRQYPDLDPLAAFAATHRKGIARYFAELGSGLKKKAPKREMVSGETTQEVQRRPGQYVPFEQIFAEELVD